MTLSSISATRTRARGIGRARRIEAAGVAPQALVAATQWAFDHGFHRVQLEHSVQNQASCRAAAKAHSPSEGTRRSAALHADGWHDMHLHGRVTPRRSHAGTHRRGGLIPA